MGPTLGETFLVDDPIFFVPPVGTGLTRGDGRPREWLSHAHEVS